MPAPAPDRDGQTGRLPCRTRLRDGREVVLREIKRSDRALIEEGFSHLTERSIYLRFLNSRRRLSEAEIAQLIEPDGTDHVVIGALAEEDGVFDVPVGLARFVRLGEGRDHAEFAITVVDGFQGKGAGRLLMDALRTLAAEQGIRTLEAIVHPENARMLRLLDDYPGLRTTRSRGEVAVELPLA